MHVLITRPQECALTLANELQRLGYKTTIDSLIRIIPLSSLDLAPLSSFEAIITTSQQAIRCLANLTNERSFPLWCVGTESAKLASNLGFQNIHTAEGTATNLVTTLAQTIPPFLDKPLLHLSGDVIRIDIVNALQAKGIKAKRTIVYQTQEAKTLSSETYHAIKTRSLEAILFYSPRTAHIFKKLCKEAHLTSYCASLSAICLSNAISQEIQDLCWKKIEVAKKATTDDLLMALKMAD